MGEVRGATDAARTCDMFEERYTMLETKLGIGTYASVYAAECRRTGKAVAVKVYDRSAMRSRAQRSVQAEVQHLRGLRHRGVVRLEGWYEESHAVLVVLERLSGGDLVDWLEEKSKEGGCSEKEAIGITAQLLEALEYLHREGVVHRDVKLENIMFECEERSVVKLVDFGFATRRGPDEKVTGKCGSVRYMAPEVLSGRSYDERCDIYSLGVVVSALLTSSLATTSTSTTSTASTASTSYRRLGQGEESWCDGFPHLSQDAQEFVQWLVAADPEHRPFAGSALQHPWLGYLVCAPRSAKKEVSPRALYRAWARDLGLVALLACGVRVEAMPCPEKISAPWPWLRWYEPVPLHLH